MHDVAQDGDHHIRIERSQQYRQTARADRDSASCQLHPQLAAGLLTWTGWPQFDKVIWMVLPGLYCRLTCASWWSPLSTIQTVDGTGLVA